jgi:hypothetical protein
VPGIAAQPDNSIRVAMEFTSGVTAGATVFYLTWQGNDPVASYGDAQDFVQDIADAWTTFIHTARFHNSLTYHTCKTELLDALSALWRVSLPMTAQGTDNGDECMGQVAYLVNFVTPDPRRGGKSRWYLPGMPRAAIADIANVKDAYRTALDADLVTLINALKGLTPAFGSNVQLVEMSFYNNGAPRLPAHAYEIFTGTVNPVVATQRRRVDRLRVT